MAHQPSRRELLVSAAAGAGALMCTDSWAQQPKSANERLAFACIGVGGKGSSDTADAAKNGDIVAICDVDQKTLYQASELYPNAKLFADYRRMLDEMGKSIDAVTVSTPDHTHAPAASLAMRMGKHCFCQKPLTHSLYEARKLAELAKRHKVATQMGNQGTAGDSLRLNAAMIRAGALGTVTSVHVWTNRPIWPQGQARKEPSPVPATLDWDLWIGSAPMRPYAEGYHSFAWRGWWDFGTGALGDMACHTLNLPFHALDLRNPSSVSATTSGNNRDSYPKSTQIQYKFPAIGTRRPISLVWYDGGNLPPQDLLYGEKSADSGSVIVGDKGVLYTPGDYGGGGKWLGGATAVAADFVKSPGHFEEWVRAIRGGEAAMSNFPDYSVPLTETVLLGNLAVWADGATVEWEAKRLRAKNVRDLDHIIRPKYRAGYSL